MAQAGLFSISYIYIIIYIWIIWVVILPIDFHIFPRASNHQPDSIVIRTLASCFSPF
jgi:hypothetical protein